MKAVIADPFVCQIPQQSQSAALNLNKGQALTVGNSSELHYRSMRVSAGGLRGITVNKYAEHPYSQIKFSCFLVNRFLSLIIRYHT